MAISKLITSTFAHRRVRVGLTVAAIALSVSLVVAVTSGYSSAEAALQQWVTTYLGTNNIQISPKGNTTQVIADTLVDEIKNDPDVLSVAGRLETEISYLDQKGEPYQGPPASVIGVKRPEDQQVLGMRLHAGEWFDSSTGDVAVIDQVLAEKLGIWAGDELTLVRLEQRLKLKVAAVVHKPKFLASYVQTVYLPLETLQKFVGRGNEVSRILIDLKTGRDEDAFAKRWLSRVESMKPALRLRRAGEHRKEMEKNLQGVQFLSYMGGTVSMLAATFIIFATLSMGVAERQRTLAMLRAIGATKWQIARLVIIEGLLLALIGIAVGIGLGIVWTHILATMHKTIFAAGVVISRGGLIFAICGTIASAILASFFPAYSAMRVDPLEAMSPQAKAPRPHIPWLSAAVGLLLISIDPFLLFVLRQPREVVFYGHFVLGLPGIFLGFFLLAPAAVYFVERTLGGVMAKLFRVNSALLRQQLSGAVWRASGTAAALMVGLAILNVMQTHGRTMLSGWRLPTNFPDVFIMAPSGLDFEQTKILNDLDGIRKDEVLPIAIASPEFGSGVFAIGAAAILPEATMFFGIDPDRALHMLELEYREGNAVEAMAKLKQGGHLIVTDEFRQLKDIHVGSKLSLKTQRGLVDYTVAAVVWSPGLDVLVSWADMGRQFDQRTAASVFGSLEDAKRDFGIDRVYLFAANLEYGIQKEDLAQRMGQATSRPTTQTGGGFASFINAAAALAKKGFQVGDIRHIKHEMVTGFYRLLMLLSTVALAAIAVASLGVTNTIMASVRSRLWQFGILRSIGVTRSHLLRLILAEAVLLGCVACVLGTAAGMLMSVNAHQLSLLIVGYAPPMVIPWHILLLGIGLIIAVATAAAAWPAYDASRKEPLELLQWGRASA